MTALAAITIFPVLILLLVALARAENMLGNLVEDPAPATLRLPVAPAQLRLVEDDEHLAA